MSRPLAAPWLTDGQNAVSSTTPSLGGAFSNVTPPFQPQQQQQQQQQPQQQQQELQQELHHQQELQLQPDNTHQDSTNLLVNNPDDQQLPSQIPTPQTQQTQHQPPPPDSQLPAQESQPHQSDQRPTKRTKTTQELAYEQYVTRDALQAAAFKDHTDRHIAFLRQKRQEIEYYESLRLIRQTNPGAVFGQGYLGFGNGITSSKPGIIGPRDRRRLGRISRELRISREEMHRQSEADEMLVPVRLDMEFDKARLRDTFTWNMHERAIPLDIFSENLCEDYNFPLHHVPQIVRAISEQISDFQPHIFDPSVAKTVDPSLPYTAYKDDDMRVMIKLDITVGQHNLVDQFEWDINDPQNNPEDFARTLCQELSLPPEFLTAISHAIREQTQLFTKSLLLVGHPFDGRPVEDDEIRRELCPSITDLVRPKHQLRDYTPVLYELTEAELGKADKDSERENRWKRRQGRAVGRRGGIVLPDLREPMRTFRTPLISSVLPCAIKQPTPPSPQLDTSDEGEFHYGSSTRRTRHAAPHFPHAQPAHHPPPAPAPVQHHAHHAAARHHNPHNSPAQPIPAPLPPQVSEAIASSASASAAPSPSLRSDGELSLIVKLRGRKIKQWMIANAGRFK